jgi:hypothetical protein
MGLPDSLRAALGMPAATDATRGADPDDQHRRKHGRLRVVLGLRSGVLACDRLDPVADPPAVVTFDRSANRRSSSRAGSITSRSSRVPNSTASFAGRRKRTAPCRGSSTIVTLRPPVGERPPIRGSEPAKN